MTTKHQKDVLKEIFAEKGVTNHIKAIYYNKLGNEIVENGTATLKELYPTKKGNNESEEWKIAYSLVSAYINDNNMELTKNTAQTCCDYEPMNKEDAAKAVGYAESESPISNIIHDQKMFNIIDPDNLDYDLPASYYLVKQ